MDVQSLGSLQAVLEDDGNIINLTSIAVIGRLFLQFMEIAGSEHNIRPTVIEPLNKSEIRVHRQSRLAISLAIA